MAKASQILLLAFNCLLLTTAIPQYGGGGGDASIGGPGPAPAPAPAPSGGGGGGAGPAPAPAPIPSAGPSGGSVGQDASSSSGSSSGGGGGSSGGDLSVQCKATPDGSGKIKYDCSGVNKDAITLKTEHFLWLENTAGQSQNLDIEIPNYSIDEFIKAAYKQLGPQQGAKINVLLKKPDVTYNAEKQEPKAADVGAPAVSVNYQPVDKISVHYPTQKQYSQGGGNVRGSRAAVPSHDSDFKANNGYRYYFIRQ